MSRPVPVINKASALFVAAIELEECEPNEIKDALAFMVHANPRIARWMRSTLPTLLPEAK